MSTRSVIARVGEHEGEFAGRYHHWDGMPTGLGQALWKLLHGHFDGDLDAMLKVLIDRHPAGWSTVVGKDFSLKPGYTWQNVAYPSSGLSDAQYKAARAKYEAHPDVRRPQCFCHGKRHEPAQLFTHEMLKENNAGLEWLYVFDEAENRMYVRDLNHREDLIVDLGELEPSWEEIECGPAPDFPRCHHYAWFHNLTPKTSNLSTQTFLGRRPLEFHDAIAFIKDGKRYAATGSGGNSDYLNSHGKKFPRRCWIATVKAGNGRRMELPVASITENGYKPLPGVAWVMPPTRNNPNETITVIS